MRKRELRDSDLLALAVRDVEGDRRTLREAIILCFGENGDRRGIEGR